MNIKIDKVVETLLTVPSLTAVFGTRIYWWEPVREQSWLYLVLNTISQSFTEYDRTARVEARICSHNENITKKTLNEASEALYNYLVDDTDGWQKVFWTFKVYKVCGWVEFVVLRDEKNRNILIQDFIFYFTS